MTGLEIDGLSTEKDIFESNELHFYNIFITIIYRIETEKLESCKLGL